VSFEVFQVPDEALELAAAIQGADSIEAKVLAKLRRDRARDRQVYAFRCGEWWLVGPKPDALTELAMIEIAEERSE
jgi:hypothetical protein